MKTIFKLLASGALGAANANANQILFASAETSPTTAGLVNDSSGFGNNGKLKNAPCLVSAGAMVLNFTNLTGVTITSWEGTSTLAKSGNTITCTAGTLYNIVLSNGKVIPCYEGAGILLHSSDVLWRVTISGETSGIWSTQNTYFYGYANDVSRFNRFNVRADVTRFSYKSTILTNDKTRRRGIASFKLQDFVVKATIITTSSIAQAKPIISFNYTNSTNLTAGFICYLTGANTALRIKKSTSATVQETITSSAFTSIGDGLPHEVAFVKNGTAIDFYVDGILINSTTFASATINYETTSTAGVDTCVGADNQGTFYGDAFDAGYIYNAQFAAYSSAHVTNITNRVDFGTPVAIWRLNKKKLWKGAMVYQDEVLGIVLTIVSSSALIEPFGQFAAGSSYGYPKGRFWKDLGYTLDLTNGGANASLSGKETALTVSGVRNHSAGDFKFYNNYEGKNIRTYLTALSAEQVKQIDVAIGYAPSDAVFIIDERGQSNMQGFNPSTTDPAAEYLALQDAQIYADVDLSGNPAWEDLQAKVNCEGIADTDSVSMNVAIAYTSQADLGADKLKFVKYGVGGTAIYNIAATDNWSPSASAQYSLVNRSNAYAQSAVNALGLPSSKIFLSNLSWYQGETDISNGVAPETYYRADLLQDIESFLDTYIALGVDTSRCVVQIFVTNYVGSDADNDRLEVRVAQMEVGMSWFKYRPTLIGKCADFVFIDTDSYAMAADNIHVSKIGQVNIGVDSYNNVIKNTLRTLRPI